MKKVLVGIVICVMVCMVFSSKNSVITALNESINYYDHNAHKYPVYPGSNEWNSLSIEERLAASYVSRDTATSMTDAALVDSVVSYPFIVNIFAYNTLSEGIEVVQEYCPILDELLKRNNIEDLLEKYIIENRNNDEGAFYQLIARSLYKHITGDDLGGTRIEIDPEDDEVFYVRTPKHSLVRVYRNLTWADFPSLTYDDAVTINAQYEVTYSATAVRGPNPKYNCHSYAWHSTLSSNPYWMDSPSKYIIDGSYVSSSCVAG